MSYQAFIDAAPDTALVETSPTEVSSSHVSMSQQALPHWTGNTLLQRSLACDALLQRPRPEL